MPPVICIVGKSKIGKTRLMEDLIKDLKSRGFKVGALKYHKHQDFEMDIEGKDTWKYAKAGADTIAISSSVKFGFIKKLDVEMELDEISEVYFHDCDIVLADGYTMSDKPRIIVADDEEEIGIFERGCPIVAIVGSAGSESDEMKAIVEKIIDFSLEGCL